MTDADMRARRELGQALKRARKQAGFSNAPAFLAAVREEQGSAPSYSTYAQWESGEVGAREESLAPIRRFHEARGTWPEVSAPDMATALMALAKELAALREERQQLVGQVQELQAMVREHDLLLRSAPRAIGSAASEALGPAAQ